MKYRMETYTLEQLRNGCYNPDLIEEIHVPETEDWREWADCATIAVDEDRNIIYSLRHYGEI